MKKILLLTAIACILLAACESRLDDPVNTPQDKGTFTPAPSKGPASPAPSDSAAALSPAPSDSAPTSSPVPSVPAPTASPTPYPEDPSDILWWKSVYGDDRIILTKEQIRDFNEAEFESDIDLVRLMDEDVMTVEDIKEWMTKNTFPAKEYIHKEKLTASVKEKISANRNLEALESPLEIRYAVAIRNASVRAFPSDIFLTDKKDLHDYLQESGINFGEPMILLFTSGDGRWAFAQTFAYSGWVSLDDVAFCEKEQFEFIRDSFLEGRVRCSVKSADYIFAADEMEMHLYLRMGTWLPFDGHNVHVPFRTEDGTLAMNLCPAPEYFENCPDYTADNFFVLAERILGTPYSWGDREETGMDCSSTVQAIYRCFGMFIPRNSSRQARMAGKITDVSALDNAEKSKYIMERPVGTLLYMQGHVMLYIGECGGKPYILHNTTAADRDDGGTDDFYSCVITALDVGKTGRTYLDRIIYTVEIGR